MRVVTMLILLLLFGCDSHRPKSMSIRVPPESTWSTLCAHLRQGAEENCSIIKVNGVPFYVPDYNPYGDPHERGPARKEEPPWIIAATEPVDAVEPWVNTFHLKGALVQIGADVPVSRVTRLAEIFDHHRILAGYSITNTGLAIIIWQTSSGYIDAPISTNVEETGGTLSR